MKRSIFGLLAALLLLSARADAHSMHFLGPHPIAAKYGGGFCVIEAPHIHVYAPDHAALYQRVGDQMVFTGDPTPFGYEGEKHPFYGHHPVMTVSGEPVICYIDGPHFHAFAPPSSPDYQVKNGVAFYVGAFPPGYAKLRGPRARVINAEYRPYVALRPTVEVTPPEGWSGEVWRGPGVAVAAPGVEVSAPGVVVAAPGIAVSAPGVIVGAPGVVVGAPGVIVGPPGVIVGPPGVIVEGGVRERGPRGPGRHEGWYGHEEHREVRYEHHDEGRHEGWGHHGHH